MKLSGDYHTHTIFSHGKGTILENAIKAKEMGLKEVGISDHGFAHSAFGIKRREIPKMASLCREASTETGVNVLLGVESNIIGTDGTIDLSKKYYDYFDILLAGVHKFVMYKPISFVSTFAWDTLLSFFKNPFVSKGLIKRTTKAYINVIKNNPIDVITHLNFCCYADAVEVCKCASDYGTFIELNAKKTHLTDEELSNIIAKTNVNFVIGSDAHTPSRVGEISLVNNLVERVGVPEDRIMNVNGKTPNFRFKAFKEGR
ncbi:MAG: PHP domain-containing protein [Firmicutes bacterium]|nr:PHP domain-containing protein [Candidatus Caballimonas caccae]